MTTIYFDTSAYVKIFNQEAGSDIAASLFELAHEGRVKILMSIWCANETYAAVDRLHRRMAIRNNQREQILATVTSHIIDISQDRSAIQFIPLDRQLVNNSKDVILRYKVSADDALHPYTAYAKDCEYFIHKDDKMKYLTGGKVEGMPLLDITSHKDMNPLMKAL